MSHLTLNRVLGFSLILISTIRCNNSPINKMTDSIDRQHAMAIASTGNGFPSGSHFNLNITGKSGGDCTSNSGGNVIFVPLFGKTNILLSEGPFKVLDSCGLKDAAAFQLPSPDSENDGITEYSVFARALGKPGGSSTMTTCATDKLSGEVFCSVYSSVQVRSKGKSTATNVSKQLLYVYADIDGDGTLERYPLFDDALEDYYWEYNNNGLKLLQLRFYPVATNVN